MEYYINNFDIISALQLEENLSKLYPDPEFVFNLSRAKTFKPLPMLMMGSIIRRYRKKYPRNEFKLIGGREHTYAGTMGFFKYISPEIPYGKAPGEATGNNNYIPITHISMKDLRKRQFEQGKPNEDGLIIEDEASRLSTVIDRGNRQLHFLFTYLIREILRNIPEHAETDNIWICGQHWPSYNLAEIAIMDEGIGIYKSLIKNYAHREYIRDNKSALEWSLRAGISQATLPSRKQRNDDVWANSGFGLYVVNQVCTRLNGVFSLISYDDYIQLSNNDVNHGKTSFHGTAIGLKVPTSQIQNAKLIISEIALQGEKEAEELHNAFKKASMPSKGLIEKNRNSLG